MASTELILFPLLFLLILIAIKTIANAVIRAAQLRNDTTKTLAPIHAELEEIQRKLDRTLKILEDVQ